MTTSLAPLAVALVTSAHPSVTGPLVGFNAAFFFALATLAALRQKRRKRTRTP